MNMPLDQWRREVSHHLDLIEGGADIILRHVEQLPIRPEFDTKAEAAMRQCEAMLSMALTKVRFAQALYRDKGVGT